ncbi:serine acetyltransferase [Streptococcus thermophilus]|uniref:Serine acetyltransferase n=1 Tax=Streptococcus thermophilus TaxID=1308 RepID=A0A3G6JYW8_STRTR|nr:serine O-acetyltransferase EpsC [Streptococcus thermophilus]AZA18017.1 MAG: serine acetyltransferase [Streptococcus thermophilus]AZA23369.1 MAG: serine acetyltransferase [Streptococcus thermophilus]MCT2932388.1 serine acetyltransferase [Streptococcus thermophilus]MCT2947460.1 serine acetyltransferase [Streptococcus thermophilus]QTG32555.1 serine acetyltransferase [Streptococcus thermophilus]
MSLRGARKIFQTARSILKRNPVAHSLLEVLLTYPGIRVLFWYRIAHFMAFHRLYTIAGFLSQHAAKVTGISISPEAKIGKRVFIDHGIGVVIGATAMIEDDVTILHGVTLGARRAVEGRRHPYVKKGTFIDANAQLLGTITIGAFSKVGAGAIVLNNVADKTTVVGNPALTVNKLPAKVINVTFTTNTSTTKN